MLARRMRMAASNVGVSAGNDSYTVLLIHSDTSDGSTTFTDSGAGPNCPHTITPTGNVHHETDQKKFGATSIYFDGTGDYLSVDDHADFEFAAGDFTVDLWVRLGTVTGNHEIISKRDTAVVKGWAFLQIATGINFYATSNDSTWDIANGVSFGTFSVNTWYHLAVIRDGNTWRLFKDGVESTNWSSSLTILGNNDHVNIGTIQGSLDFNGYMDEIRISKGIARWTANFTPPTGPYS